MDTGIINMINTIRRVLPHEYIKYRDHLKNLDSNSRYLRFGYAVSDSGIDNLCDYIDKNKNTHILFCVEDENLSFVAIGHIAAEATDMELAFSVFKEYQGAGIGAALMTRCIQWCRTHNMLNGHIVCLSSNDAMKRICVKNGMHMQSEHGEATAALNFELASFDTYMKEASDSNLGVVDWFKKRTTKFIRSVL
jgi:GNAT superfamily N-acetyltransferase